MRLVVEGVPAMSSSTINFNATLIIESSPERLWPLLSDTGRVDRAMGIPPFERSTLEPDLSFAVSSHYLGVPVAWREYPYEWVFEQWYQVARVFLPPLPIERVVNRTTLTALPGGKTQVDVSVAVEPRGPIGWLAARLYIGRKLLADLMRTYRSFGELALANALVAPPPPRKPAIHMDRLALGSDRLSRFGMRAALIERLATHLRSADDPDVLRMRPFALADAWGEDRLEVLRLFLYATRAGLLDLEWDVICPNCRGASVRTATLAELELDAHCSSCNIRYDVNFDESVELRFSVSADIRDAVDLAYCIGGPANTRHIVSQIWLPPRGSKQLRLRLAEGSYRLRSRQLPAMALLNIVAGPSIYRDSAQADTTQARFEADAIVLDSAELAPGEVMLNFQNSTGVSVLVLLEQTAWSSQAASAALVTALDVFRQLFSSQVLAPGIGVAIRNLTFLFSDLKGSTMLYDTIGDSPAYARVRDHFDVMKAIIAQHHGALVKTIGDAVMAVFPSAEDAVEASLAIQREFIAGQVARGDPALHVKLGLHRGPCIAVNANDLLDYFGSTVNIAARVQNESIGGDIVVTPEVLGDPGVRNILDRESPQIETFERELKGFTQAFTLSRLWVADAQAKATSSGSAPEPISV
jgi:class 3 adenylate cyclase